MTDEPGSRLLRDPRSSPRTTFLELFFDLVFVFALTRVSQRLVRDLTRTDRDLWVEAGQTLVVFLALWLVWAIASWVTSRYDPEQAVVQVVMFGVMFGSMVIAVALPEAFGKRAMSFAVAYVAIQIGRPLILTLALGRHPRRQVTIRVLCWSLVSAVPWLAGALGSESLRGLLWSIALVIDYAGLALGWPIPRAGASRVSTWAIAGEHLVERYQQFFLIALGENILIIGFSYSAHNRFDPPAAGAFVLSFVTTALIWRIYFHRAGHLLAETIRTARAPGQLGESASWTHLVMVAGVLCCAVGFELAITHPFDRTRLAWGVFMLGGPALFLLARTRFEYEVFGRISRPRVIGVLVLLAAVPVAPRLAATAVLAMAVVVLAAIAAADARRAWGRPPEPPASPWGTHRPG